MYLVSNQMMKKYRLYLDKIDLTYTQYIVMILLWNESCLTMREICNSMHLSSSTISPVLARLEQKNYLERCHFDEDERYLAAIITEEGNRLKNKAEKIPKEIAQDLNLETEELKELYKILYKLINE